MPRNNPVLVRNEEEENAQVRKDLVFVITLNLLLFAILLTLYFFNRSTGKVDSFFSHLLKF
jgi:hypothetical protein